MQVPLQLNQPGTGLVRTPSEAEEAWVPLGPGHRRQLHWPAAGNPVTGAAYSATSSSAGRGWWTSRLGGAGCGSGPDTALKLSLRVSQPGWSWSSSVPIGAAEPGETLVKVSYSVQMSENPILSFQILPSRKVCPKYQMSPTLTVPAVPFPTSL